MYALREGVKRCCVAVAHRPAPPRRSSARPVRKSPRGAGFTPPGATSPEGWRPPATRPFSGEQAPVHPEDLAGDSRRSGRTEVEVGGRETVEVGSVPQKRSLSHRPLQPARVGEDRTRPAPALDP